MSGLGVIPIGGVDGVGQNSFLYYTDTHFVLVDCGVKPLTHDQRRRRIDQYSFGMVSIGPGEPPDLTLLDDVMKNKKGIAVFTHAHLDHIGAIAQIMRRGIPIYMSKDSRRVLGKYAESLGITGRVDGINIVGGKDELTFGDIRISFFPIRHSIPGTQCVLISANGRNAVHLGDFKFNGMDSSADESRRILQNIRMTAGHINCLFIDPLNIEMPGFTPEESKVIDTLEKIIKEAKGRVIISLFSSNLARMEAIAGLAKTHGRQVGVVGSSMVSSYQLLGHIARLPSGNRDVVLIGGSQGEETSTLIRAAQRELDKFEFRRGDTVVLSSRCIPGNEGGVRTVLDYLAICNGIEIVLNAGEIAKLSLSRDYGIREMFVHVSGHGHREDVLDAIMTLDPEVVVPFHAPVEKYDIFERVVNEKIILPPRVVKLSTLQALDI